MTDWMASDGGGTGLEETRCSVLSDWLEACSIAFVPKGRMVTVTEIPAAEGSGRLAERGIVPGVYVECLGFTRDRLAVRLESGRTVSLGLREAWAIQVATPTALGDRSHGKDRGMRSRSPRRWFRGRGRR